MADFATPITRHLIHPALTFFMSLLTLGALGCFFVGRGGGVGILPRFLLVAGVPSRLLLSFGIVHCGPVLICQS